MMNGRGKSDSARLQSVGFGAFFRGNCKRTAMADRSLRL